MKFNIGDIAAGYKTHAVVISAIGVIWFGYFGGGMTLGDAVQQTLTVAGLSTVRMAVARKQ